MQIRATGAERLAVATAASLTGQSLSEFIRAQILNAAERMRIDTRPAIGEVTRRAKRKRDGLGRGTEWRMSDRSQVDPLVYDQVRRVGVNLNQIAKRLNTLNERAPPELPILLREIRTLLAKSIA